jgi:cell wall-associated NlpC family hydrolase
VAIGAQENEIDYEARKQEALKELALRIEPSGKADVERIGEYPQRFELFTKMDRTLFYFSVKAKYEEGRVIVNGSVSYKELKNSFITVLRNLGVEQIEDQIEVLPSKRLGDKLFGVVKTASALTWSEPDEKSIPATQCIYGDIIYLLDVDKEGFYLCLSPVGYVGFIKQDAVKPLTKSEARRFIQGKKAIFQRDFGTTETLFIPMGAKLGLLSKSKEKCKVLLPDGSEAEVPLSYVAVKDPAQSKVFANDLLKRAREYLETPYVFGAKVRAGSDCSGFVQTVFRTMGIYLPRDAKQQALVGEVSGARWYRDDIAPGDTLFFIDHSCRIIHVGLYLGDGRFIHCFPPKCGIESHRKEDSNYSSVWDEALVFAKHVIDF